MGEGDGIVNLMSIGYMCNKGWNMKWYNLVGVKVIVVEMLYEFERFNFCGGFNMVDYVDILGRFNFNEFILRIVVGRGGEI